MRRWRVGAALALAAASQAASAHGSVRGLGNFFSGVVHPLFEPAQLLAIVALGLLIGQRSLEAMRPSGSCFVAGAALGLAAAWAGTLPVLDTALLVAAGMIGIVVLSAVPVPRHAVAVASGAVGLAIGTGSDPETVTGSARVVMLLGSGVGACVWLFNIVGLVQGARRHWMQIGVRVAGSWIAASATLVIALWIAGTSRAPDKAVAAMGAASPRSMPHDVAPPAPQTADLSVPLRVSR